MNYEGEMVFTIEHSLLSWEAKVLIDFNFPGIMKNIKNMVEFWSDWENRLDDEDDDYVRAFLKQLGLKIIHMMGEYGNLNSMIEAFNWDGVHGEEGYCEMNGTKGIKILDCDRLEFDYDEFEVSIGERNLE